jgi:hypothetical protein
VSEQAREGRVDVAVADRVLEVEMQPKDARRRLQVARLGLRIWVSRIDQAANRSGCWHQLVQQLQPFRPELVGQEAHARTLPPSRLELDTRPYLTGSPPMLKATGMVAVAALATSASASPPVAAITDT